MPFPDSLKTLVAAHAVRDFAALAQEAMRGRRWEAALGLTEHVPPTTVMEMLARCSRPSAANRQWGNRLFDHVPTSFEAPSFLDEWVVGLLKAGVTPALPLSGIVPAHDQSLSWTGPVHAFAMLMGLPKTWDWLAHQEPSLAPWEKLEVTLGNEASTLLHLAVKTERWHWAKKLVDGGFSPHAVDAQGALAWEKIFPHDMVAQTKVLDALNLWPRTDEELRKGWERRGLAAGLARRQDLDLRTYMGKRLDSDDAFEMASTIDGLLRLRRVSDYTFSKVAVPQAAVDLWKACSHEDRHRAHTIEKGPLRGQWSLAQAVLYVAAINGLASFEQALPPGTVTPSKDGAGRRVVGDEPGIHQMEPWSKVVRTMPPAALDQALVNKRLAGHRLSLTARGMWALAHMEWVCCPGRRSRAHPAIKDPEFPPVTQAWAHEALTALMVLNLMNTAKRQDDLSDLFTLVHGFRMDQSATDLPEVQEWLHHVSMVCDPVLTVLIAKDQGVGMDRLVAQMRTTLPAPERPLTDQERQGLPDFWAWLSDPATYANWAVRNLGEFAAEDQSPRGLLTTLVAWGQTPSAEQVEAAIPLIERYVSLSDAEQLRAEWRAHQAPPSTKPRDRPRMRT